MARILKNRINCKKLAEILKKAGVLLLAIPRFFGKPVTVFALLSLATNQSVL